MQTIALTGVAALAAATAPVARAQLATIDKGHNLLLANGLQMWGLNTDSFQYTFNYNNLTNLNLNAVAWSHGQSNPGILSPGQQWSKWVFETGSPSTALNATEQAHYNDLLAIQVGDEQQSDIENPNGFTKAWFNAAHAGNYFTDKLMYVNSTFVNDTNAYLNFIASANPDAIAWDAYPFGTTGVYPYNWLGKAQIFRRCALGSYIGASGAPARPYGLYLQTYHGGDGARDPGELEMRWQQFTAWTLGYTFVSCFTAGGGNTSLFVSGNGNSPNQPIYNQFKESARQSRNLGPALTRLISYGYGPNIVLGKDAAGVTNAPPIDWPTFNAANAPASQQYLTSVSAVNTGTKNNGFAGDVYVGFFNPLHTSFGPSSSVYFMVTNALGAYLQDPTATVADCQQSITLNFNFGNSGINSLQRLRRSDGVVEVVPLTFVSGNQWKLTWTLEGGTGDLFKYNDGTSFVGFAVPSVGVYWDNDASASGNNTASGAGLGGTGNWDTSANKWYNGTSNAPWTANNDAIFHGTAGTVTLSAGQSANSIAFKSNGYSIVGSTLTMTGTASVSVDAGMTATIDSQISGAAGLTKNGAGTLNLTSANNFTGGLTVNDGVLGIVSGAVGANPSSPQTSITVNNGATVKFNQAGVVLSVNRGILLGSSGGTFETSLTGNGIAGVISGSTLTKTGTGTLSITNTNTYTGGTVIKAGAILVTSDANLGAAPTSLTTNITLDGGTLRFGANMDIANTRGIEMGAAGGTIDTQGFTNPSGYNPINGFRGGDLTKMGSGTFFANATSAGFNTLWTGNLIIKEGTWKVMATDGLPMNPTTGGLRPAQVTLDGGTWQIGNNMNVTQSNRGITVGSGGGVIDTQTFNLTWPGPIAGAVSSSTTVTKIGTGTLRFNSSSNAATYSGTLHVSDGQLQIAGGTSMGDNASITVANSASASISILGNETIGSLAGGGGLGGNLSINTANTLTTGGNGSNTTYAGAISGAGNFVKAGTGTMTLAGSNSYGGTTTISAGTLAINGSNTGTGAVSVASNATLAGSGTVAGAVSVSGSGHLAPGTSPGTLMLTNGLALSASVVLDYDLASTNTVGSNVNDLLAITGALTLGTPLTFNLNAYQGDVTNATYKLLTYTGSLTGNTAGWSIGNNNASGSHSYTFSTATPGEINLIVQAITAGLWTGNVSAAWDTAGNWSNNSEPTSGVDATFNTPIPGTGATLTLTAGEVAKSLTFIDNYTLSGGDLTLTTGTVSVSPGKTVNISSQLAGSAGLTKTNTGTLQLSSSNSYTGGTNINGGTITISADNRLGTGGGVNFDGGTLNPTASFSTTRAIAINASGGTIDNISAVATTLNGNVTGAATTTLTKSGTGTLVLNQPTPRSGLNSTWLSDINVTGGTLKVGNGGSTGFLPGYDPIAYAGLPPVVPIVTLSGGATLEFNHVIGGPTQDATHAVMIAGAGGVLVSGGKTEVLVGNNTYTGPTVINNGSKLRIGWGGASNTGTLGATAISNNGTLTFSNDHSWTFGGSIAGSGSVTKEFGGTLTLNGATTYSGPSTVAGGRLVLNQSLASTSSVSLSNSAVTELSAGNNKVIKTGALSIGAAAKLDIADNKLIVAYGTAASPIAAIRGYVLNGRGGTDFANGTWNGAGGIASSVAAAGDLVSFAVGYVDNSYLPQLGLPSYTTFGGQSVDASSVLVRYTLGADANLDGKVNTDDVTIVGALYNSAGTGEWFLGDFDYDGTCDSDDVTVLGAMYDATAPALSPAELTAQYGGEFAAAFERGQASAVPEPATSMLLTLASGALLTRRRRSRL